MTARLALAALILASLALAATAADAPVVEEVRASRRRLARSVVSAPEASEPETSLAETIARLRAMRVPERRPPEPPETRAPAADADPSEPGADPTPELTKDQLARLAELSPAKVADAASLGDALFRGGHWAEAYRFYARAVETAAEGEAGGWALYQMANCVRHTDPAEAARLYARVAKKHGDSPWAGPARIRAGVVRWYDAERPATVRARAAAEAKALPIPGRPDASADDPASAPAGSETHE